MAQHFVLFLLNMIPFHTDHLSNAAHSSRYIDPQKNAGLTVRPQGGRVAEIRGLPRG